MRRLCYGVRWLRHRFGSWPAGLPHAVTLRLAHQLDDGALFYLNGVEILRVNVAASNPPSRLTRALSAINSTCVTNSVSVTVTNLTANSASAPFGPWAEVPNMSNPYTDSRAGPQRFYRLKK